jgi:ribosomal protein L21E
LIDFKKELELQLKRLEAKYKVGNDVEIVWEPRDLIMRPHITTAEGKTRVVQGEWTSDKIIIYENESLEKAIHVLNHEFIERMLCTTLVDPYVVLSNALQNVFKTLNYLGQEKLIEKLAKMEDKTYGERISGRNK